MVPRPRAALALVGATAVLFAGGCGASSTSDPGAGSAKPRVPVLTLKAKSVPGVGTVLVNGPGYVLYVFEPDHRRSVTCTGACAGVWPPVMERSGSKPVTGAGVNPSLLGSDSSPAGGRVVTYNGWPLYGYRAAQRGQATGQDIDLNGGKWYVIRPSGQPVVPRS